MKTKFRDLWAVLTSILVLVGCQQSSNDRDADSPTITNTTGTSTAGTATLPTLAFDFPQSVSSSSNLTLNSTIIERWATDFDRIVTNINNETATLNELELTEGQTAEFTVNGNSVSVKITEVTDGNYSKEATICVGGSIMRYMQYNESGTLARIYHNHGVRASATSTGTTLISEITYTSGTTTNLTVRSHGQPFWIPAAITAFNSNYDSTTRHYVGTRDGDGAFTFTGVNAFWDADEPVSSFTIGQGYLAGTIAADGSGRFVAYRQANNTAALGSCDITFNETSPNWCLGRAIGGTRYTDDERANAWIELGNAGLTLTAASTLATVTIPSDATCN